MINVSKFADSIALALLIAPIATSTVRAESAPHEAGVIEARNPKTGVYMLLDRRPIGGYTKMGALFLTAKGYYKVDGDHASVQFPEGANLEFAIWEPNLSDDPNVSIKFFKMESYRGMRIVLAASARYIGEQVKDRLGEGATVQFAARKSGTHLFIIAPTAPLPPGEYLITAPGNTDGFTFSISTPNPQAVASN